MSTPTKPLLIYDGDCAFCQYCVEYARAATGSDIDYRPYQAVQQDYPEIGAEAFRSAIYLVEANGARSRGAEAAFRTLEIGGYTGFWSWCYRRLPLFAALSERCYTVVSRHRGGCYRCCRLLFGGALRPATMHVTTWVFLRLLALVYLAAFGSFAWQAQGLIGSEGILPLANYFRAVDTHYGPQKYPLLPSLFWLDTSDTAINAVGIAGCALSVLLFLNLWPRLCLIGLYVCYLSLYHGGQLFMSFQWDVLLLECGFLAIFLPTSPVLVSWLYRWLLFRFMLQSGLVKLLSGDPAWRDLSALDYHFETQPLPTVLAWYADKLPEIVLRGGVLFTYAVELVLPFLILMPRRPRAYAALAFLLLELIIFATGSYNYFNLLTMLLCLLLLDDRFVAPCLPAALRRWAEPARPLSGGRAGSVLCAVVAVVYAGLSSVQLAATGSRFAPTGLAQQAVAWSQPFHIANAYGLFAVMTRQRNEIIFEGSRDGVQWHAYELPYKPGAVTRAPVWATPLQPRLDWQLWFAALAPRERNPWLQGLVRGLLTGSAPVLALFEVNPFADQPPQYVRASLYRYQFSGRDSLEQDGAWWQRDRIGSFWPVTALRVSKAE